MRARVLHYKPTSSPGAAEPPAHSMTPHQAFIAAAFRLFREVDVDPPPASLVGAWCKRIFGGDTAWCLRSLEHLALAGALGISTGYTYAALRGIAARRECLSEGDEPNASAPALELWALYLDERRALAAEVSPALAQRDPVLTARRALRIEELVGVHGFDVVKDAIRGLRFSDWHRGEVDDTPKLDPERLFSTPQVERLADLLRRYEDGESLAPSRPYPRRAGDCDSLGREAEELARSMGYSR